MIRHLPANQLAPWRQRGFSLFEFGIVAAVFALLVGFAANRLHDVQRQTEIVAAEQLMVALRASLQMKIAQLYAAQRNGEMARLLDENPIGWLAQPPKNYLGEYYAPDPARLPVGYWYFDRTEKQLIYLLSTQKSFAFHSLILLKFKVESSRLPLKPAQQTDSSLIENVALIQVFDQERVGGRQTP